LQQHGELSYQRVDEGDLSTSLTARVPAEIDRSRVKFEVADAMDLRDHLGAFDVLLMANLIDRLRVPQRCLERLPGLVNPAGQLIITSPYTWLEEFTPREHWLGGFERDGRAVSTLDGLLAVLEKIFSSWRRATCRSSFASTRASFNGASRKPASGFAADADGLGSAVSKGRDSMGQGRSQSRSG
jgi:SAM-dependent methyltransferase